jgi:hypothetical protein
VGIDDKDSSPPARARVLAFWPPLAWLVAFIVCRPLTVWSATIGAACWGLLLLLSFVAWGRVLVRAIHGAAIRDTPPAFGWGLEGSIGMAVTLVVFGVLACLHLVSVATIALWSAAGPLAAALTRAVVAESTPGPRPDWRARVRAASRDPAAVALSLGFGLLGVLAVLHYAGSVMDVKFNTFDDQMAYRDFARQFLDTGTLYEPFSYRRVGAFGGQSLLQAMVLAFSDRDRLHLFDNGICVLLIYGLILGFRGDGRRTSRAAALVAGLLLLTLPYTPHNIASALSGVLFFLALFRLFDDSSFETGALRSNALLAGLLAAAVCTLRQNYLSAAVGFVAFVYLACIWSPGERRRSDWFKAGVTSALAMLGFLVPWLVLSTIAARTPFYPIVRGNMRPDFGIIGKVSWAEELRWALENLVFDKPISTIALFFVAAALLPFVRRNRAVHAFMFANAWAFALMMHFFQTFNDAGSIARYYLGFSVAFCFAAALRAVGAAAWRPRNWRGLIATAIVLAAVGIQIIKAEDTVLGLFRKRLTALQTLVRQRGPAPPSPHEALYTRIQASVPPGEPMLVTLDHTYLFDGKRNEILNYDHPGAVGPRGGPPCFQGPEAFARYLKSLGIRYLVYQIGPSSAEYNPGYWIHKSAVQVIINGRGNFYKIQARFELDFFDAMKALTATRRSVFQEGEIHVLDLETPRA